MANLISNEWKHTLETTPTSSVNSLVSLYDLFYDEDGKLWVESTDANAGTALDHDIICLNRGMLTSGNKIDTKTATSAEKSTWWTFGIDTSIPLYDARSKYKEVDCNASLGDGTKITIFQNKKFRIYDKDAALAPNSISLFTCRSPVTNGAIQSPDWTNFEPPSVGVFSATGDASNESCDILLSCPDSVFKSTLVTQDGYEAYNRIMINPYTWYAICLVVKATGMDYTSLLGSSNFYSGINYSQFSNTVKSYKNFWSRADAQANYLARAVDLGDNSYTLQSKAETNGTYDENRWFYLLKNTFVWVRAPFYGDYIVPEDFNQDLNTDAKVVHNELMLSGAGDFKKYDVYSTATASVPVGTKVSTTNLSNFVNLGIGASSTNTTESLSPSETTLPYIPKTSPTVDIYTSLLLDGNGDLAGSKAREDTSNFSTKLISDPADKIDSFLDDNCSGNDPLVRGLPIAPINRTDASNETSNSKPDNLAPVNYFDPESRMEGSDYAALGRFPTIIPKDGNLYVDGRIIGPTIDEIWIMLKKLTGGRLSDFDVNDGVTTTADKARALNLDIGIPYGSTTKTQNDTDTTMTEVPDSQFNFKYEGSETLNKKGDPIDFVYSPENGEVSSSSFNQTIKITKFINQNDAIVYPVYKSLKDLSTDVTTFDTTKNKDRGITNFTAWNGIGKKDSVLGDNATILTGAWGPREAPYSLRELEAMVMGNKFNIITQARFIKENFAVTGKLGKTSGYDEEDMYNYAAGSLYQMHKDYNFDVTDPNTFYNAEGTANGLDDDGNSKGARATIDDNDIRTETQIKEGHIRFAETYGTSTALNYNAEKYSSSDVYLSAGGDWRYVSDHNRIPCLRAEY